MGCTFIMKTRRKLAGQSKSLLCLFLVLVWHSKNNVFFYLISKYLALNNLHTFNFICNIRAKFQFDSALTFSSGLNILKVKQLTLIHFVPDSVFWCKVKAYLWKFVLQVENIFSCATIFLTIQLILQKIESKDYENGKRTIEWQGR